MQQSAETETQKEARERREREEKERQDLAEAHRLENERLAREREQHREHAETFTKKWFYSNSHDYRYWFTSYPGQTWFRKYRTPKDIRIQIGAELKAFPELLSTIINVINYFNSNLSTNNSEPLIHMNYTIVNKFSEDPSIVRIVLDQSMYIYKGNYGSAKWDQPVSEQLEGKTRTYTGGIITLGTSKTIEEDKVFNESNFFDVVSHEFLHLLGVGDITSGFLENNLKYPSAMWQGFTPFTVLADGNDIRAPRLKLGEFDLVLVNLWYRVSSLTE